MIVLQADFVNAFSGMWPILLMFVVIWFFMIRPQAKKNKAQKNFIVNIAKGDEVATSSGLVGRINQIDEKFVHLQVDKKAYIKILRSSISKEMTDLLENPSED